MDSHYWFIFHVIHLYPIFWQLNLYTPWFCCSVVYMHDPSHICPSQENDPSWGFLLRFITCLNPATKVFKKKQTKQTNKKLKYWENWNILGVQVQRTSITVRIPTEGNVIVTWGYVIFFVFFLLNQFIKLTKLENKFSNFNILNWIHSFLATETNITNFFFFFFFFFFFPFSIFNYTLRKAAAASTGAALF